MALQFDEADDTKVEPEVVEFTESETITYTRKKKAQGCQQLPPSLPYVEQKACAIPFLSGAVQASPRPLAEIFFD